MRTEITKGEWNEFVNVVQAVVERHQDVTFIETAALSLKEDVYHTYRVIVSTLFCL